MIRYTILLFSALAIFLSPLSIEKSELLTHAYRLPAQVIDYHSSCSNLLTSIVRYSTKLWTEEKKELAFYIMQTGSENASRTVAQGRRFLAPETIPDGQISEIADRNFQATLEYVLEHINEIEINKNTAIKLNRMLTQDLVPIKIQGDYLYRTRGTYINQTDKFVRKSPEIFYNWLSSDAAQRLHAQDPISFAEILHNNIAALDSFPDGNGRLSRLLADIALMKKGLAPAFYTDMSEYFKRGNARSPVSRSERIEYFKEIVERGRDFMQQNGTY